MTTSAGSSLGPLPQPQAPHRMTPPTTYLAPIATQLQMLQSAKPRSSHHLTLLTHHRFTLSMHADTLRPPWASECIKVSQCQFKTELTTAILAPEACSSARETRIRKAFVSFGHYLVHPLLPGKAAGNWDRKIPRQIYMMKNVVLTAIHLLNNTKLNFQQSRSISCMSTCTSIRSRLQQRPYGFHQQYHT